MKLSRTFIALILFLLWRGGTAGPKPNCSFTTVRLRPFRSAVLQLVSSQAKCFDETQQPRVSAGGSAPGETILVLPRVGEGFKRRSGGLQKIARRDCGVGFRSIS